MSTENTLVAEKKETAIFVSDKAKVKVKQLLADAGVGDDPSYFLRVSVVGGGCSGIDPRETLETPCRNGGNEESTASPIPSDA
jgi:Fe-S cluster assembly iron-binding protein IscA